MIDEPDDETPLDVGDRAQVKDLEKRAKARAADRDDFLIEALRTRQGRIWYWDFLGSCGVFHNPFNRDTTIMAFTCGEINAGQKVLADIMRLAPEAYSTMIKENQNG